MENRVCKLEFDKNLLMLKFRTNGTISYFMNYFISRNCLFRIHNPNVFMNVYKLSYHHHNNVHRKASLFLIYYILLKNLILFLNIHTYHQEFNFYSTQEIINTYTIISFKKFQADIKQSRPSNNCVICCFNLSSLLKIYFP